MIINGHTVLIPHIGYPTHAFKAPLIYNPYFAKHGINALVVPMACQADNFEPLLRALFKLGNTQGALITMPHKVTTVGLVDEVLPAAAIAGAASSSTAASRRRRRDTTSSGSSKRMASAEEKSASPWARACCR